MLLVDDFVGFAPALLGEGSPIHLDGGPLNPRRFGCQAGVAHDLIGQPTVTKTSIPPFALVEQIEFIFDLLDLALESSANLCERGPLFVSRVGFEALHTLMPFALCFLQAVQRAHTQDIDQADWSATPTVEIGEAIMQQVALPFKPVYFCINFGRGDARGFQSFHERLLFIGVSLSSWSDRRSRPLRQLERMVVQVR